MSRAIGLDHIVLNVTDVERSLAFYGRCLGLGAERLEAWRRGEVGFPSLRVDESTIIDLVGVPAGQEADAGRRTNMAHFCLVAAADDLEPLMAQLGEAGVAIERGPVTNWGARGMGRSIYFRDPDGNLVELRAYGLAATDAAEPTRV